MRLAQLPLPPFVMNCAHFVRTYAEKYGKRIETVPARAMTALQAHEWPGNVRELQHVIERALILTRGTELAFDEEFLSSGPAGQGSPPRIERLEQASGRTSSRPWSWLAGG